MELMQTLRQFFETFATPKAEPICLNELPSGMNSLEAVLLGNYYKNAFEKGLFSKNDSERVKTILRNARLHHGGEVFSEERIEATLQCLQDARNDFSTILKNTVHADTRLRIAETPEIWRR